MAEFWVAVSFFAFLLIVLYYKVPSMIAKILDERAETIRKEIDEARRLREDAQKLLADYQQKHRSAGQEPKRSSRRRAARRKPSPRRRAPA
jgi:F-type H+-transporting ATPase subunit b